MLALFLLKRSGQELPLNGKDSLLFDSPIISEEKDSLGYTKYAKLLSKRIKESYFERAYAIGVNGKWGLGKTSFINLLKADLKNDIIEIDFNPWTSHDSKAIIIDFFESIQEGIAPYHSSISNTLNKYADKLIKVKDNSLTQSMQSVMHELLGDASVNTLYGEINGILKRINKKIIIYIDDLDRLNKEEIIEIIKLIRNTANFYNTFFIVAYDRDYLTRALKMHNSHDHEQFLEKIFQLEITLPYFERSILITQFAERLTLVLPESYRKQVSNCLLGTDFLVPINLYSWLITARDVTRLANSISLNIQPLIGNIEVKDFIRIEVLRLKFPSVYKLLYVAQGRFFKVESNHTKSIYQLARIEDSSEKKGDPNGRKFVLEAYLEEHFEYLSVPEVGIRKIVDLVEDIFPNRTGHYSFSDRGNLSIVHPSKFYRYFAYGLLRGELSEIDFSIARSKSVAEFMMEIENWIAKGLEIEVQNRFYEINDYDDRDDFEKIINAIFYLANYKSKKNQEDNSLVGYDSRNLYEKLSDYNNKISEGIYAGVGGKESMRDFLIGVLNDLPSPFLFSARFLQFVEAQFGNDDFIISKEEIRGRTISYFSRYCKEHRNVSYTFFTLFWTTEQTEFIEASGGTFKSSKTMPHESIKEFKNFVAANDLDGYLSMIVETDHYGKDLFTVNRSVLRVFDSWEKFKEFLLLQEDTRWRYLNEFISFFNECEEVDFSQYIEFNFSKIPVKKRGQQISLS